MEEQCKVHEMSWCAICNGDAKKFEQDEQEPWYEQLNEPLPTFPNLLKKKD